MEPPDLWLHEEVLLMALKDREGTVSWRAGNYSYAMAGALLAEMALASRIEIAKDKKQIVTAVSREPFGEDVLDDALARLTTAKRPRGAPDWVGRFAGIRHLRHRVAAGLCERGVLRREEGRVLWVFKRALYPTADPEPERQIKDRLEAAILGSDAPVDPRTAILLALAHACYLLGVYFEKSMLKEHKARIEEVASGQLVGRAAKAALEAAQAAVAAATAAAAAATAATTAATS